jgi:hypothetical protein
MGICQFRNSMNSAIAMALAHKAENLAGPQADSG